jgi:hypothetical protein
MHAINARLFVKKLIKVIFFAPSKFFLGALVLFTRLGTENTCKIKAIPIIPEST